LAETAKVMQIAFISLCSQVACYQHCAIIVCILTHHLVNPPWCLWTVGHLDYTASGSISDRTPALFQQICDIWQSNANMEWCCSTR